MRRRVSLLLFGVGIGSVVGAYLGNDGVWFGAVIAVAGVGLAFIGPSREKPQVELPKEPITVGLGFSGLGDRTEQILRLADDQAAQIRKKAERQAERTLSAAQSKARNIVDKARAEATGLTGITYTDADGG